MFKFDHRIRSLFAHVLDRILIAKPVRALDGVVHVPAPIIRAHVAKGRTDSALRSDGMASGREHLGNTGGRKSCLGETKSSAQPGATGADDDDIATVIDQFVVAHQDPPSAILAIATTAEIARNA